MFGDLWTKVHFIVLTSNHRTMNCLWTQNLISIQRCVWTYFVRGNLSSLTGSFSTHRWVNTIIFCVWGPAMFFHSSSNKTVQYWYWQYLFSRHKRPHSQYNNHHNYSIVYWFFTLHSYMFVLFSSMICASALSFFYLTSIYLYRNIRIIHNAQFLHCDVT